MAVSGTHPSPQCPAVALLGALRRAAPSDLLSVPSHLRLWALRDTCLPHGARWSQALAVSPLGSRSGVTLLGSPLLGSLHVDARVCGQGAF